MLGVNNIFCVQTSTLAPNPLREIDNVSQEENVQLIAIQHNLTARGSFLKQEGLPGFS
jgi:hypothetical protein